MKKKNSYVIFYQVQISRKRKYQTEKKKKAIIFYRMKQLYSKEELKTTQNLLLPPYWNDGSIFILINSLK